MKTLKPVEISSENFKDYGQIISFASTNPDADNEEFKYWSKVSQLKMSSVASTGILVCQRREPVVSKVERHVKTPEVLIALEGDCVLCAGKPSADGTGMIEGIQAFYIKQGTAFAMNEGTWHWVPFPVNHEVCKFLVVFALGTEDNDLEIKDLPESVKIII